MLMNPRLEYWTADQVAECLSVGDELYVKLWNILSESKNRTPMGDDFENETPDCQLDLANDDKAGHWWDQLSESEQERINTAYVKEYGDDTDTK